MKPLFSKGYSTALVILVVTLIAAAWHMVAVAD